TVTAWQGARPAAGVRNTQGARSTPPRAVRLGYDGPMGQRSRTASVAAVMAAFFTRRKWTQADLARAVDLRPAALRAVLQDLCANGIPLESQRTTRTSTGACRAIGTRA